MEAASSWRPPQGDPGGVDSSSTDWRSQLQPDSRRRIVNKIMDTLKKHLPTPLPEGVSELEKIAVRFEEKIYMAAANQADYLRKISLKMISMDSRTQTPATINLTAPNNVGNQSTADSASLGILPQVNNQGQSLIMPTVNQMSQRQTLLNNIPSSLQGSSGLPTTVPSMSGINQSTLPSVGQGSNLQNMPAISQNTIGNSVQGGTANMYANAQRQIAGRQQPQAIMSQHLQQSPNSLILQHQRQQQMLKKMPHPSVLQPHMQQQQQQQQQPLMQMSSNVQANPSSLQQTLPALNQAGSQSVLQQNQPNPIQQSMSSMLQQHPPSLMRQQQSSLQQQQQQQSTSGPQQPLLSTQQQQLMGQQSNLSNTQQSQPLGQQNGGPDSQQQQRLSGQQNGLVGIQQPQQMLGQQNMPLHQQQQLNQQSNISGLQQQQQQQQGQQQQLGSHSNVQGLQQQQQSASQNGLTGFQQQQLGSQSALSAMQQQQQQQLLGSQSTMTNLQQNQRSMQMLNQAKAVAQQQNQQSTLAMLHPQSQQSQMPLSQQQQAMAQMPSQNGQLQQQFGLQQQTNTLQREMQQRFQSQNAIDQQKQFVQPQRILPEVSSSTSLDSTAQTGQANAPDWQEEIYQKIKFLKETNLSDLIDLNQKLNLKFQQAEMLPQPGKQPDHFEKLKVFKLTLERTIQFLQLAKSQIQPGLKEKLPQYERQIASFIGTRNKKVPQAQQQPQQHFQPTSGGHPHSLTQQQASQFSQMQQQQQENHMNQVQQMNIQNSVGSLQPSASATMLHVSMPLSTQTGVPTMQQGISSSLQPSSNPEAGHGSSLSSLQQGPIGVIQQNTGSLPTSMSITSQNMNILSQNAMNSIQPVVNPIQPDINALQQLKQQQQEQQFMQNQQIKQQLQQRQIQQQIMQQQQQQPAISQQLLQQQRQQQTTQMPQLHQIPQLHHMSEDMKMRQAAGIKSGLYTQHFTTGQRHNFYNQQLKASTFPTSSSQNIQASSPQISQHSSPHIDQHSLLPSHAKTGTPMQAAGSPFVVPSPSTPVTRSPVPIDPEKQLPGVTPLSGPVNSSHQQTSIATPQLQSLGVGTPGISASPLLAEFSSLDGNQANFSGKLSSMEQPLDRLIKAVQSLSSAVLRSSINDIGSVVSMTDRIAGSAPGNGSRAAVSEDLVAMTKCRLQARNFMSQDGSTMTKKMKRNTTAIPLNVVSSVGSHNESFRQSFSLDSSEVESTATSCFKRRKAEVNHVLLEEIKDINKQLIDTVVSVSDEDVDSVAVATDGREGTVVKCLFGAVALSPGLKSQFASAQISPILPLRLLVPVNYPKCSPVLLDKLPLEASQVFEDLSARAKSRFSISLRSLPQPMSLGEMARTWDICARAVITEYAQQTGGGSFSSTYGVWENCVGA